MGERRSSLSAFGDTPPFRRLSVPLPAWVTWGAALAFWLALAGVFWFALTPTPPMPGGNMLSDKAEHVLAFLVLTLLGGIGYPRLRWLPLGLALGAIGALIEALQGAMGGGRVPDLWDWIADMGAVILVIAVLMALNTARRKADPAG